jgi:threonylcarbamoyladenosine tRNA methylthiotransferase MtaB
MNTSERLADEIGPRASLHTLGCRLNQSETAALAAAFMRRGYRIVPFGTPAEVVIINSCSVTVDAERECRKLVRGVVRRNPNAFVAITGCYAQVGSETLRRLPGVDLIVGSEDKLHLAGLVDADDGERQEAEARVVTRRPGRGAFVQAETGLYPGHTRANLKVQDGCNVGCSFCIIPRTRGGARSRRFDDVLREAAALVEAGHQELVITGVNLGSYQDAGADFAMLLAALDALPGVRRLRISSIEPSTLTDAVLDLVARSPRICRHLHVPVQSGDDAVLAGMRRPYTRRDLQGLFQRAHGRIPKLALGTDVMVGFPGEDDAAFRRTLELVTQSGFTSLHVFSYSPRPGTAATRLAAEVPRDVVRARSRRLHEVDRRLRAACAARFVGHTLEVLFEERKADGLWEGLTDNYLRVAVPATADAGLANRVRRVRADASDGARCLGRLVDDVHATIGAA